jgi:hypothetical protein
VALLAASAPGRGGGASDPGADRQEPAIPLVLIDDDGDYLGELVQL